MILRILCAMLGHARTYRTTGWCACCDKLKAGQV